MGDSNKFDDLKIVEAESEAQAKEKFENFWRNKTSEYSTYYNASTNRASGVIT